MDVRKEYHEMEDEAVYVCVRPTCVIAMGERKEYHEMEDEEAGNSEHLDGWSLRRVFISSQASFTNLDETISD